MAFFFLLTWRHNDASCAPLCQGVYGGIYHRNFIGGFTSPVAPWVPPGLQGCSIIPDEAGGLEWQAQTLLKMILLIF